MASPTGGQFVFSANGTQVTLGINNGTTIAPSPVSGNLNIEVFTASGLNTLPALDSGFQQGVLDPGGSLNSGGFLTGTNLTLFGGTYLLTDQGGANAAIITLGSGNQSVVGAAGDTLIGGSGSQSLDATKGGESVVGGTGSYFVFGGANDTITGPVSGATASTTAQLIGAANERVTVPNAGNYTVGGGSGMTVLAATGSANVQVGMASGEKVDMTGNSGNEQLLATAGNDTVTAGSGPASIYGGVGDRITMGTGNQYADGTAGSQTINIGAGGVDTIVGGTNDTINGGGATLNLPFVGAGSTLNLSAQTGGFTGGLNATAGNVTVTLGAVSASVFGGAGDTVTFGSAGGYADGTAGGELIKAGSGGVDTVIGSSVASNGDTINGGAAGLRYDVGSAGGDLLNLAGSTGSDTINAFFGATNQAAVNDTVIAGNGADSVWGGGGDRIGVGPTTPGGTHLFDHSTTVPGAAVAFGTNDSVAGTSNANVTVTNFNSTTDTVFYASRSTLNQDATIIASATSSAGNTTITLPDGTTMTFIGLASASLLTGRFTS